MGMDLISAWSRPAGCAHRKDIFIDDYDLHAARHPLQGVDVWLNTPRRPYEACGPAGSRGHQRGLTMSVSDGWWPGGRDGTNGWTVGPVVEDYIGYEDTAVATSDAQSIYRSSRTWSSSDVLRPMRAFRSNGSEW